MSNPGYRCFKCEGKNSLRHGLYCWKSKRMKAKAKKLEDDLYKEKDNPYSRS